MARGSILTRTLTDGSRRYDAAIRIAGRQRCKTFAKRRQAEQYLDMHSTDIREGTYRELKKATFAEYISRWKTSRLIPGKLKPATLNVYGSNIAVHLIPAFGPRQLTAIDSELVTAFEAQLLSSGQSGKSTGNIVRLLGRILNDAKQDGYLLVSPMTDIKLNRVEREEARCLSKDEVRLLLAECADPMLRLVVLIGLLAGLRRSEIFGLHWEDIDVEGNVLNVRRNLFWKHGKYQQRAAGEPAWVLHTPKTKSSIRAVDLSPRLAQELAAWKISTGYKSGLIFRSSKGTPLDPHNVMERQFKPAVARALDDTTVTLHTLRHTYGSVKLAQGENIVYVARQMGHASPSITANVYAHLLEERRPQAAAKTDAFLFEEKPQQPVPTSQPGMNIDTKVEAFLPVRTPMVAFAELESEGVPCN